MKTPYSIRRTRLKQVAEGRRIKFPSQGLSEPSLVVEALKPFYKGAAQEILSVLTLNSQLIFDSFVVIAIGGVNASHAKPVDVLKPAILSNSPGLILIHNHPSGIPEPSKDDIEFTVNLKKACELMGLELYDHIIISDQKFYSFKKQGVVF